MVSNYLTLFSLNLQRSEITHEMFHRLLNQQSPVDQHRVLKHHFWQDQCRVLAGACLVRHALTRHFGTTLNPMDIIRDGFGRPYSPHLRNLGGDFNVSHHGLWVVCALSAVGQVGIDIACASDLHPTMALVYLSQREQEFISEFDACDKAIAMAKFWAIKEAILKMCGCGLSVDPQSLEFDMAAWNLGTIHFTLPKPLWSPHWMDIRDLESPGAVLAMCSDIPPVGVFEHHVDWSELYEAYSVV